MTDGLTGADDLDLAAVARDDAALEALRAAAVSGDPVELSFDDPALDLLAALVDDLDLGDLAEAPPVPLADVGVGVGVGATVLPLAVPSRRGRSLRRGAVATTAAAAAALSVAGVAAAQPGSPLRSVRDAVTDVFASVTPGDSAGDRADALPVPSVSPTTPGPVASAGSTRGAVPVPSGSDPARRPSAGSAGSSPAVDRERAKAVRAQLNACLKAYEAGRYEAAARHLDRAEALLPGVSAAAGAQGLRNDLAKLRAAVDQALRGDAPARPTATATARPSASPSASATPSASASADGQRDDDDDDKGGGKGKPDKTKRPSPGPSPSPSPSSAVPSRSATASASASTPGRGRGRETPARPSRRAGDKAAPTPVPSVAAALATVLEARRADLAQSSMDASAYPRA